MLLFSWLFFNILVTLLHPSATLLLVPLLGMQYILTPFRPEEGADGAFAYELISAIIISFQVGDKKNSLQLLDLNAQPK